MAQLTKTQLLIELEKLRSLCSQQEIRILCDNESMRLMQVQINILKDRLAAATPELPFGSHSLERTAAEHMSDTPVKRDYVELAKLYCKQNNVTCVDFKVLKDWHPDPSKDSNLPF